jgi:integrase
LAKLKLPKAPGPARDRALSIAERRDWCRIIMLHDPDPVLAALVWMLWIIYGARDCEVERLKEADFNLARSSLVLVGKDGSRRERPMHRPLARLLHDTLAARPHAPNGELLRGPTGHPVTGRTWDRWSDLLHRWAPWAVGFRIGPYSLRHTTARQSIKHGFDTAATGRYIGHAVPGGLVVPANYGYDWTDAGTWDDCVVMAEAIFGSLDSFPALPENDILGPVLGLDLPTPPPTQETSAA